MTLNMGKCILATQNHLIRKFAWEQITVFSLFQISMHFYSIWLESSHPQTAFVTLESTWVPKTS